MERVAELMSKGAIYTASPGETVEEAARRMKASAKGCLIVVDAGVPKGIVTERDIVHKFVAGGMRGGTKVADVMSSPLLAIGPMESVAEAARRMSKYKVRRLAVIDKGALVGVLSVTDLARRAEHAGATEYLKAVISRGELLQTQEAIM